MCQKPFSHIRFPLLVFLLWSGSAFSQVSSVPLSSKQKISAPRWIYNHLAEKSHFKGVNHLVRAMVQVKLAEKNNDRALCMKSVQAAKHGGAQIKGWLAYNELQCSLIEDKKGRLSARDLALAIHYAELQKSSLLEGPTAQPLKNSYITALLELLKLQLKSSRRTAWKTIDKLDLLKGDMSKDQRAALYKAAGELAFIEQHLLAAQDFIQRSLREKDSPDLRAKLESIQSALLGKKVPSTKEAPSAPTNFDLGVSKDELTLYDRLSRAIEANDYVSAVEDAMNLIHDFPGGIRAQKATGKVIEIYLTISASNDDKYRYLKDRIVKQMLTADAGRLANFAQLAFSRENFMDALNFGEESYRKYNGDTNATKVLALAARAAVACGEYSTAEDHFNTLATQATGTTEAVEAVFRLGLLKFREGKWSDALGSFERALALPNSKEFEYRALYWQWRTLQKLNLDRSKQAAQELIAKYPVTYYGLRARAELNGGLLKFDPATKPLKTEIRMLPTEKETWKRFLILLRAGWWFEAQSELASLPKPQDVQEKALYARLWGLAFRYDKAAILLNQVWDESADYVKSDFISWAFPQEFKPQVAAASKKYSIDPLLVFSLIKQESAFLPHAESHSHARGLMQLIDSTAGQMAEELNLKNFDKSHSSFDPDINIRMGVRYLARTIRQFNGNIPLALAAYNAGPSNLKRWLASRPELKDLANQKTSSPEVEIWIDELPWTETSFYVKAILRNLMIYRALDQHQVQLADPVWKSRPSKS